MKYVYRIGILIVILLSLPVILWYLQPENKMNTAIVDKTVPDETYREHLGITWVLNHFKFTKTNGEKYREKTDYFGFMTNEKEKKYKKSSLPDNYDKYDMIYLADTYGVYDEDLPWAKPKERKGARSQKIDGGLKQAEWDAIADRLDKKKKSLLIAEFNTFASPTENSVRKSVTGHLGLEWNGWIGRYFKELDPAKNAEIPKWVLDQYKDKWKYKGAGFLLVNDFDNRVVVLESEKHVNDGIRLKFTEKGKKQFGINANPQYNYWFDIVTPAEYATVLAKYDWSLTVKGKEILKEYDIPESFAAVIQSEQGMSQSYYFAGDYNDVQKTSKFYQFKGVENIYALAHRYSDESLYWSAYVPMMGKILNEFHERKLSKVKKDTDADSIKKTQAKQKITYSARVNKKAYEILIDGKWKELKIKGVNIGMGKPGSFPGEAAITEDEYYRWFKQIAEMNANTIRVYTLHPPGFYNALKRYNDNHEKKIYVFHGVWINEQKLVDSLDAFEKENVKEFQNEMRTITDVIHGNANVKAQPGHASGRYRSDVSEYVIGWVLGIEWYPFMVENTNIKHKSIGDYEGKYFKTKKAAPFEHWLASQMDILTTYEMQAYGKIRPMSFTNWPTTDLLTHPSDSTGQEDLVTVDPNTIYTKGEASKTGQFASYHIYPYYPDFMNYDRKYSEYIDHRGKRNNYAGYLKELHEKHRLPILVAEFGVPGSRGLTHENPQGWNQGFLSEKEQGDIVSHLYEDIMEEKMLGGLVFTWQDEWFKRTWNTMDQDHPERRPFWSNAQTNEQQFGLLSFDRHKIKLDGNIKDWTNNPVYKKNSKQLRGLYADYDERYLYLRVDLDEKQTKRPLVLLDIIPNQGNTHIKGMDGVQFSNGVDFVVDLRKTKSKILIDKYYDFFTYQYGYDLKMIKTGEKPKNNSGQFIDMRYALNKEYYITDQDRLLPFSSYNTGKLRKGNGNPVAKDYDSLADYNISDEGITEVRIPWLLIQAKDPSRKEFIGNLYKDGIEASQLIKQINIGALYTDNNGKVIDSFPEVKGGKLENMKGFTWDNWEQPQYEERLKQSYYILKNKFAD